jgi:lysophospholipase L1-like esterase
MTTAKVGASWPRRKRIAYAATAMTLALVVPFLALLGIDIYLHGKYQKSAGFNVWGYRGPVVGRKAASEYRLVVLGGSTAFGYGTSWDEAIPAVLERLLAGRIVGPFARFRAINLGYNNEGAYSFKVTLADYQSMKYDLVCLYEGYNDLMANPLRPNVSVFRHESPVFRLTGYLPIFPIIFKEKAAAMLSGGADALYRGDDGKTRFRPGLHVRTTAEVLRVAADVGQSLERQLGKITTEARATADEGAATGCKPLWRRYCQSTIEAVDFARRRGAQVIVASQPYEQVQPQTTAEFAARHREQQSELAAMLGRRYGGDPDVRYVNLGDAVDLRDPALSFDGMHLTAAGNARVAAGMVQPVVEMAERRAAAGERP